MTDDITTALPLAFQLADKLYDGRLADNLHDWRNGDGSSYDAISRFLLVDKGIDVSAGIVRRWCIALRIEQVTA